jgi:NAD(P)H-dependent FMN reductase
VRLKVVVLIGTVRSDRQGIKAARFVERMLTSRGHDVTVVDPFVLRLPLPLPSSLSAESTTTASPRP